MVLGQVGGVRGGETARRRFIGAGRVALPSTAYLLQMRLRLVTSQGSPYPSRSPRAHPSGWTRTQGLSHRDSHAPPSFGTTPVRMWNWPLAPLLRRAGNQVVREMPSHTRPSNPGAGSESSNPPRRPLTITRRNGTNGFNGCHGESVSLRKLGRPGEGCEGRYATDPDAS